MKRSTQNMYVSLSLFLVMAVVGQAFPRTEFIMVRLRWYTVGIMSGYRRWKLEREELEERG